MSNQVGCIFCDNCDPSRVKDKEVRCVAYSEWREPFGDTCEHFFEKGDMEAIRQIVKEKGLI